MDDTHSRVKRQHGNGFAVTASALAAPLAIALGYYVGARLGFALTLAPGAGLHAVAAERHPSGRPGAHPASLVAARAGRSVRGASGRPVPERRACGDGVVLVRQQLRRSAARRRPPAPVRPGRSKLRDLARHGGVPCRRVHGHGRLVVPRRRVRGAQRVGERRLLDDLANPRLLEHAGVHHAGPGHPDHRRAASRPPPGGAAPVSRGSRPLQRARRRLLDGLCRAPDGSRRLPGAALCAAAAARRRGCCVSAPGARAARC